MLQNELYNETETTWNKTWKRDEHDPHNRMGFHVWTTTREEKVISSVSSSFLFFWWKNCFWSYLFRFFSVASGRLIRVHKKKGNWVIQDFSFCIIDSPCREGNTAWSVHWRTSYICSWVVQLLNSNINILFSVHSLFMYHFQYYFSTVVLRVHFALLSFLLDINQSFLPCVTFHYSSTLLFPVFMREDVPFSETLSLNNPSWQCSLPSFSVFFTLTYQVPSERIFIHLLLSLSSCIFIFIQIHFHSNHCLP